MAITFVGSNFQQKSGANAISLSLPASLQNDLVVVLTACRDETKGGPPSTAGYTTITDLTHVSASCRLHASYKFMGSTPDTLVAVPATGDAAMAIATIALVFRGVSTSIVLDVAVVTTTGTSGAPNAAAITPANNDCCIVVAAASVVTDSSAGAVSGYAPLPSVQITADLGGTGTGDITIAASYKILSGGASSSEDPLTWTTWSSGAYNAITLALRPLTTSTDINTVDRATITSAGKAIVERELVAVSKATISYLGKTIGIPDSSVEAIFVDKAVAAITGKTVDVIETFRAVTVDKASVLYRGRAVTVRDVQFEDIPRYSIKGRGSGHWMETR